MYRDLVLEYKDDPENKGDLFSITDELFLSKDLNGIFELIEKVQNEKKTANFEYSFYNIIS